MGSLLTDNMAGFLPYVYAIINCYCEYFVPFNVIDSAIIQLFDQVPQNIRIIKNVFNNTKAFEWYFIR